MPPCSRSLRRVLVSVLSALAVLPVVVVAGSSPAGADTSQFRGVNWAVPGDNFKKVPLVLDGLNQSDSYATVRAKADAVYNGFASQLGVNTVRLPVNTHTVSSSWWNAQFTIDAASAGTATLGIRFANGTTGARLDPTTSAGLPNVDYLDANG